jgi:hypothetical protein
MVAGAATASAQTPAAPADAGPVRQLAPGVLKTVDPLQEPQDTVSRHDVTELLAADPKFDWAKDIEFRRDIWGLVFSFKPVRMIEVEVPQPDGRLARKQLWYLVYSVTNSGKALHPVPAEDGTHKLEAVDKPIAFVPEFVLYAPEFDRSYADVVVPAAIGPIRTREETPPLLSSVEIAREVQVGETLWGVAIWEDIDPRIDRFSIFVYGLTNAYRWADKPGEYKAGDPIGKGRRLSRKALKINFWRPGDEYYPHEKEIRLGIPGDVDYTWVFR